MPTATPARVPSAVVVGAALSPGAALPLPSAFAMPKFQHLHAAVRRHFDVRQLQIAMHNPLLVSGFERGGNLGRSAL